MWLQHQSKRQLRLEKADSKRNVTLIVSWQNPIDWLLRHAGAKPREEVDYSAARQDTSSDRDCRFDQKEESSMIGRDLFNSPCRICRRPTVHRTRTRHPERKSKSEGHCGTYRANRERLWSQIPTSTQALLPTSTHSNGFCIMRVCISSSSRRKRHLKEPARLKTPKEGSTKGRKREREEKKEPSIPRNEVASHKRQPLHQSLKRI